MATNAPPLTYTDNLAATNTSLPHTTSIDSLYLFAVDSMPDSLKNRKPVMPYPLYHTLFNQARLNYAVSEKLPLYGPDSVVVEELAADSVLQRIDLKIEYNLQPLRPHRPSDVALLSVFLGILGIFTYIRHTLDNTWGRLFEAFWNPNLARQFYEDYSHQNSFSEWLLTLNGMLVMGLGYFLILKNYVSQLPLPHDLLMIATMGGVGLLISAKLFSFTVIAWIIPSVRELLRFFRFTYRIILGLSALLLMPFLLAAAFSPPTIAQPFALLSVVLMLFVVLFIAFRGLLIAKEVIFDNKFHFLTYLCTLEIVPILILIKLLQNFTAF